MRSFLSIIGAMALGLSALGTTPASAGCASNNCPGNGGGGGSNGFDTVTIGAFSFESQSQDLGTSAAAILNKNNGETYSAGEFKRTLESRGEVSGSVCDVDCEDFDFRVKSEFSGWLYAGAKDNGGSNGQSGVSLGQSMDVQEMTGFAIGFGQTGN